MKDRSKYDTDKYNPNDRRIKRLLSGARKDRRAGRKAAMHPDRTGRRRG